MPGCFAKTSNARLDMKNKPKIGSLIDETTSPTTCIGRKMQQNEISASKLNKKGWWQIRKNKPKMTKISQKHAQYAFRSKLKQKIAIKFEKKSNQKNRNLQKTSPKNKQITIKTNPKTSNPQDFKKTRNSTKKCCIIAT